MTMNRNGADNATDRATGAYWEGQFCGMAAKEGKIFTPHQLGRERSAMFYGAGNQWTLPDITIWSANCEHHEIKHKNPTRRGEYGLEEYRMAALVRFANTTGHRVLYTIHDYELAGTNKPHERIPNDLAHWVFADVEALSRRYTDKRMSPTYYNGRLATMPTFYWTAMRYFKPLSELWHGQADHLFGQMTLPLDVDRKDDVA